jgi:O-antigen ligase
LRQLLQLFYNVAVFVALTGIFEYTFSDVARAALARVSRTDNIVFLEGITGFERAGFVFWGSPAAAFICMLALPIALPYLAWTKGLAKSYVLISAFCLLVGIYISGYRSLWMLSGVLVMVALLSRRNLIITVIGAALTAFVISLMPEAGQERFAQALEVVQGISYDNSIRTREEWFNFALTTGLIYPTGIGWGGTGWSHSDLAQVMGNLGVAAGIAFVTWYLVTLWRVWRAQQRHLTDPLILALLCSFVGVGGLLLFQGVQVLPQLAMPCWFIWAVAHVYTKQLRTSQRAI